MRSEKEMFELIMSVAAGDERVRAVILNGSRANPAVPRDLFQDYDIVFVVTEVASFRQHPEWIAQFGELMILQTPEDMGDPPPGNDHSHAYLMQFMDGNRIDLTLYPVAMLSERRRDSLSVLLLDKDRIFEPFDPPGDRDYLPQPPNAKAFAGCCHEFWWVSTYVAKGLWRGQITYAKHMMEQVVRAQLMKMLTWYVGVRTSFAVNPGAHGKYFQEYLDPEVWEMLLKTYAGAGSEHTWDALDTMCELFRQVAVATAAHFGFEYPHRDDERVCAHLQHVRNLPR